MRAPRNSPTPPLESLPGIGPSLARDLLDLGVCEPAALAGRDPERLFERLCALRGRRIDRCVLYAFRCAVYAASTKSPDPDRLQWWKWKDPAPARRS